MFSVPRTQSLRRTREVTVGTLRRRLIAIEDLVARNVRVLLSLAENHPTPSKYARDFVRIHNWADAQDLEIAWQDHRHENHPTDFSEAKRLVNALIHSHSDLLIEPQYSTDVTRTCLRCAPQNGFQLADAQQILSILGYC